MRMSLWKTSRKGGNRRNFRALPGLAKAARMPLKPDASRISNRRCFALRTMAWAKAPRGEVRLTQIDHKILCLNAEGRGMLVPASEGHETGEGVSDRAMPAENACRVVSYSAATILPSSHL